jgi:hypothetical protein
LAAHGDGLMLQVEDICYIGWLIYSIVIDFIWQ